MDGGRGVGVAGIEGWVRHRNDYTCTLVQLFELPCRQNRTIFILPSYLRTEGGKG